MTTADNYHSNPDTIKNNIVTLNGLLCCFSCIEQTPVWNTLLISLYNQFNSPMLPSAATTCTLLLPSSTTRPSQATVVTHDDDLLLILPHVGSQDSPLPALRLFPCVTRSVPASSLLLLDSLCIIANMLPNGCCRLSVRREGRHAIRSIKIIISTLRSFYIRFGRENIWNSLVK